MPFVSGKDSAMLLGIQDDYICVGLSQSSLGLWGKLCSLYPLTPHLLSGTDAPIGNFKALEQSVFPGLENQHPLGPVSNADSQAHNLGSGAQRPIHYLGGSESLSGNHCSEDGRKTCSPE